MKKDRDLELIKKGQGLRRSAVRSSKPQPGIIKIKAGVDSATERINLISRKTPKTIIKKKEIVGIKKQHILNNELQKENKSKK